jgi:hypothetical protein
MRKPKRLTVHCSDERDYNFLVKGQPARPWLSQQMSALTVTACVCVQAARISGSTSAWSSFSTS